LRVAEERKRRRVQLALAASVLGFFLFAGAGAWWAREQATERQLMQQVREEREKRVREGVEQVFARLPELYDRALWEQAEAALDQATYILGDDGDADLRERVEAAKRDTAFVRSLDEIRLRKLDSTEGNRPDLGKALSKYAEAFRDNGFDVDSAGRGQIVSRLNTSSVRPYLIAAMDDWALTGAANRQQLFGITAEATGQEWRNRLLDVWNDSARLAKVYDTIPRAERSPAIIANVCYRLGVKDGGIRRLDDGRHQYPGDFWLHVYSCLLDPTNPEKMIGSCRAAMVVRPRAVVVHIIMAFAMQAKGDFDGVIASCKEILLVDPKNAATYSTLGYALRTKRDYDGAIVAYRKAIHLDPKNAITRTNLGFALKCNGERREASAHFKDAIVLDPNYAMAHDNLGYSLLEAADFPGAAVAFREAIRLDPKYKGFQPSFAFVQERLALRDRLAAVKQGRDRPNSPTEAALLANIFGQPSEKDYALAYRLFDEAVASDPSLAERSCYKAAAAAVRFAAGDDPGKKPDAAEQASLRAKAAAWLAADLAAVRRVASSPDADHRRQAAARLRRTRDDADFVAVRDPKRLATLPPEEHKRWDAFWGAVGVELAKIEPAGKSNP
jgi:tetratricopeptide (TPR) repeat protein